MSCVFYECVLSHGPLFRAGSSCLPLIGQLLQSQASYWPSLSGPRPLTSVTRSGPGWHRHMSRQLWRADESHCVVTWGPGDQSEASIAETLTNERRALNSTVCNVTRIGDIKCDGDFLAHNECIVNITLLKIHNRLRSISLSKFCLMHLSGGSHLLTIILF